MWAVIILLALCIYFYQKLIDERHEHKVSIKDKDVQINELSKRCVQLELDQLTNLKTIAKLDKELKCKQ